VTKERAFELRDKIIKLATDNGQWVTVTEELKPNTKKIKLELSIKIGNDK
jgi:hypothetical protein